MACVPFPFLSLASEVTLTWPAATPAMAMTDKTKMTGDSLIFIFRKKLKK
jgi:hypothetical protein